MIRCRTITLPFDGSETTRWGCQCLFSNEKCEWAGSWVLLLARGHFRPLAEPLFYCRSNICPWKWHSRHSCDFWFTFSLICEMYARVTKLSTQDVMWDVTNHRGWCLFQQVSTGWVTGLVSIPEGYMRIEDVCFWCSIEWLTIAISWGRNRVIQSGLGSCSLLSCRDPHPIAEIPSNPRSIPYHSPNSILTILQDSNTMLTKPPNSDQPLRPLTHYHHSLRTPNDLQEPQSHFCLLLSSSFRFSPLELWSHFHIPISVFTFLFSIY